MITRRRIHMIGISGIGMSGIARLYLEKGYAVQGSDVKPGAIAKDLERLGIKIMTGHDASHVSGADTVIYSSAISTNHPERVAAAQKKLRILHRSEALAELCEGKFTIAVTGTHGKTTTTALIGTVLREAGRDPSIVVGAIVNDFGGNACSGKGNEMVIEADESDASFLNFSPSIEVVTNIEEEHMDHYKSIKHVEKAYRGFLKRMPKNGHWFGSGEDDRVAKIAAENIRPYTLYGFNKKSSGLYAATIVECPRKSRGISFEAWSNGKKLGIVRLKLMGRHNVLNALAALGVGLRLGLTFDQIRKGLEKYEGAGRRFDVKYEDKKFLVVDDYAHHPTEIRETLKAARSLQRKRIVALFQPHRYSRTQTFMQEFGSSFSDADKLIVTDIYAASETAKKGVSGEAVTKEVQKTGHSDATFITRDKVSDYVRGLIKPGDLVISLGAGDINQVAFQLSDFLRSLVFKEIRGKVLFSEPLSKHTSLKIGGAADYWVEPDNTEDLALVFKIAHRHRLKVYKFGAGSNILAPDEGVRGVAVHLGSENFKKIKIDNGLVVAGAGVPNTLFIQFALENGLGGCEFLSGIPGCIGGSIAMNAGSHGQAIDERLVWAAVVTEDGEKKILAKKDIPFRYRSSGLKDAMIVEAGFKLPKVDKVEVLDTLKRYKDHRMTTQDLHHASAGCMFKNADDGRCSSGKLIDEAGLKGARIGGAQVSTKHANFIINLGGATASDVKQLIEHVRAGVRDKFRMDLQTEVKIF